MVRYLYEGNNHNIKTKGIRKYSNSDHQKIKENLNWFYVQLSRKKLNFMTQTIRKYRMNKETYQNRRRKLSVSIGRGIILIVSNQQIARNYKANPLPFRQDSSFLYYTGIDIPGTICLIDCDSGEEILGGYDPTIEDAIWSGPQKRLNEIANNAGIQKSLSLENFSEILELAQGKKRIVHYLPPYSAERKLKLSNLLNKKIEEIDSGFSLRLVKAIINQRSIKTDDEVKEIEEALNQVTRPMHLLAMKLAKEGVYEHEIVAKIYESAKAKNLEFAYPVICSVRGETLHNESHRNILKKDQLLLVDAGVESRLHYASDITRTTPVGGKFTSRQREIYDIVLQAQLESIASIKPGVRYLDVHMQAAKIITEGLIKLGIMKGNCEEAVNSGAHALFFPHGLGHMMGLDVHDMEDLGEAYIGYREGLERSSQFGTAYLRLAKELETGFVITVEPGIYFIPTLIEQWESERRFDQFINYSQLKAYHNFGGIRIEDNILVTSKAYKVLGEPIAKTTDEIEAIAK